MVVIVYISGISGNKEVKKRQQRVTMILESKNISYDCIDITEPGKEADKEFMQQNSKARESKHPLPPQIFNEDTYCGDYDDFELANENDELEKFLGVPVSEHRGSTVGHINGTTSSRENSADKEVQDQQVPESQNEEIRRSDEIETNVEETPEPESEVPVEKTEDTKEEEEEEKDAKGDDE